MTRERLLGIDSMRELGAGSHTIDVSSSLRLGVQRLIIWERIIGSVERFLVRQGEQRHLLIVAGDDGRLRGCFYDFDPPFVIEKNGHAQVDVVLRRPIRFLGCLVGFELAAVSEALQVGYPGARRSRDG